MLLRILGSCRVWSYTDSRQNKESRSKMTGLMRYDLDRNAETKAWLRAATEPACHSRVALGPAELHLSGLA